MVEKSLEDTIQDRISKIIAEVPMDTNNYLESKLPLFSNLKQHLDAIHTLKPILAAYMLHYDQTDTLKRLYKEKLVSAEVYQDENLLEFLLLISEKPRNFDDKPVAVNNERLGRYFFGKYCASNEYWNSKTFRFSLEHNHSFQTDREKIIEEVAIGMIAYSRASLAKAITNPPAEISEIIQQTDNYFQQAFYSTFGRRAPVSLTEITHVTSDYTEHADRVSGNTFIHVNEFYKDTDKFIHVVVHEAMHLCFNGFYETPIEEGLIEYFVEKMYKVHPSIDFSYTPVSDIYTMWKENLRSVFDALPEAELQFTQYFLSQDIAPLRTYLQKQLTGPNFVEVKNNDYSMDLSKFLDSMRKIVTND